MIKRTIDIVVSTAMLLIAAPVLLGTMFLVWRHDGGSPFYRATRVGKGNRDFRMVKLRSMQVGADRAGGTFTALSDRRITPIGHVIRRYKLDELSQFWNVLTGDMSVVGPRPNTRADGTDSYTREEMRLLDVRPGITDLSSIVFVDEGDILNGAADIEARYNAVIRPWKSRLALLYIANRSTWLDLRIIWLTAMAIVARRRALDGVAKILAELDADPHLRAIAARRAPLPAGTPPGAVEA